MSDKTNPPKITRSEFLRIAGITKYQLAQLLDCDVVQKFVCHPLARQGMYYRCQAEAVRDAQPVPRMSWPVKSGRVHRL